MDKYVFNKNLFENRIKSAREKKNLTQEHLSNILNIDINKIENEEIKILQDKNIDDFDNLISKLTEKEKTIIAAIIEALIDNR